jgi:hypothetical protein
MVVVGMGLMIELVSGLGVPDLKSDGEKDCVLVEEDSEWAEVESESG